MNGDTMKQTMIIVAGLLILLLAACGGKDEAGKSMEQLQKEQGIPVRVKTVAAETFSKDLSYNASLGGSSESFGLSMLAEVVAGVQARVGDRVSAGQVIVTFPKTTPSAQFEQATTGFNAARQAYERVKNLHAEGAVSRQDLDNAETQFKLAQANLESSRQLITVRAPISGVLTSVAVNPGEMSHPGQILFTVSGTGGYKAKLTVPDKVARELKTGTPATATIGDEEITGRVSKISLALDPYTQAVPVEVSFPATGQRISYGATAQIKLQTQSQSDVIVVNREHIVTENGKNFVWLNANGKAVKRAIETGMDNQLQFEVVSGLAPGDQLITEGISLLSDNALIRVVE